LLQGVGSQFLGARVAKLRPDVHIFGHTHFGWDTVLDDGIRYLQAPLSYPRERTLRPFTLTVGSWRPNPEEAEAIQEPFLVWSEFASSGEQAGFVAKQNGVWSSFYEHYGRRPENASYLPTYVAYQYQWTGSRDAPIGWGGQAPASAFVDDAGLLVPYIAQLNKRLESEDLSQRGGSFKMLKATQLSGMRVEQTQRVWIFDVRTLDSFERGHIEGALSVPLEDGQRLSALLPKLRRINLLERLTDPDALKIIYDDTGHEDSARSISIFRIFASAHSGKFLLLEGGLQAWQDCGQPLVSGRDDGLPPAAGSIISNRSGRL